MDGPKRTYTPWFVKILVALTLALASLVLNVLPASAVAVNGINVGIAQNGRHAWGPCIVQDFKGGPYGWVIVSYTVGIHIVRNGMLFGWFDQGGAPSFGCPRDDEHDAGVGVPGVVVQDFQKGSLLWVPGMDHAVRIDFGRWSAIKWALHCMRAGACTYAPAHVANYAGYCLAFVYDAYSHKIVGGPIGQLAKAYQWWYGGTKTTNAPFGALVLWGPNESRDGSGHIALGLGGGYMLTTKYGRSSLVHVETIAPHNDVNYLGWEQPRF